MCIDGRVFVQKANGFHTLLLRNIESKRGERRALM
jgi:hypothetical protein